MPAWQRIWSQIETLGMQFGLAAAVALLFAMPDQVLEIYRAATQHYVSNLYYLDGASFATWIEIHRELLVGTLGIVAVSVALWLTARITVIMAANNPHNVTFDPHGIVPRWAPRLLALVPPVFVAIGLVRARVSDKAEQEILPLLEAVFIRQFMARGDDEEEARELAEIALDSLQPYNDYLFTFAGIMLVIGLIVFGIVLLLERSKNISAMLAPKQLVNSWISLIFVIVLIGFIVAFTTNPVDLAQQFGTIGLLGLFLFFFLLAVTQLHTWGRRINTPLVVILVVVAIIFSALNWNDNHGIREVAVTPDSNKSRYGVDTAFERWFATREDKDAYSDRRYPIYVVAAQGGGIYAAHHVATFLSGIQDICPDFAHHMFAISGVSGGAVGATLFSTLARAEGTVRPVREVPAVGDAAANAGRCYARGEERPQRYMYATEQVFQTDFLAPLTAGLLFPDFVQRFLPRPYGVLDRSRALEYAFEQAYADEKVRRVFGHKRNLVPTTLGSPFVGHWEPEKYVNAPALVLNTTEVGSGERRVVSPFTFDGVGLHFMPVWTDPDDKDPDVQVNLPLSSAAFLSARFPWVTPAGTFHEKTTGPDGKPRLKKYRVVDGGYFENSGVATAVDLIGGLVEAAKKRKVEDKIDIVLIVFSSAGFETSRSYGMSETLEPIRAMLSTRTARAGIEIDKAVGVLQGWSKDGVSVTAQMVKLELQGHGYPLPLGWRLSDVTRHLISYQNGAASQCTPADLAKVQNGGGIRAACAKKLIFDQLN